MRAKQPIGDQEAGRDEVILLVDDEAIVRRLVSEMLKTEGYSVIEAKNGLEALEFVNRLASPIHLMLTDIIMPQMDGSELAWKTTQLRPTTRILFMSGYANDSSITKVTALGGQCICKPFCVPELRKIIREMLDSPWKGLQKTRIRRIGL